MKEQKRIIVKFPTRSRFISPCGSTSFSHWISHKLGIHQLSICCINFGNLPAEIVVKEERVMSESFYIYETQFKGVESMEKIKITVEQEKALEVYKRDSSKGFAWMDYFNEFVSTFEYEYKPLNSFTHDEFARLLYQPDSYEVEVVWNVGDWMKSKINGRVGRIDNINGNQMWGKFEGAAQNLYLLKENAVKLTPEEIKAEKERRVWNSIGREVGEVREGGVYYDKNGFIYTAKLDQSTRGDEASIQEIKSWIRNGEGKGFYPAESFISFEGDSE